ncbi:MAG: NAD(P)/FAD-dependent oxidoreductase [Pikeienuella sp.]
MSRQGEAALATGSLWTATSVQDEYPALDHDLDVDFAVIGAGFTGLSAALHLAEAGARVVVIDAHAPGWGASGRNGGQVIPGLKKGPKITVDAEVARAIAAGTDSAGYLYRLIARLGVDCDAAQGGWAQLAATEKALRPLREKCESPAGRAEGLTLIGPEEIKRRLGVSGYVGGLFDARAGTVHPMKLAIGLARAAAQAGAAIHGGSPALRIEGEPGAITVTTPGGAIRCGVAIAGPNGYADNLLPTLRRAVVPVISAQVATDPLPEEIRPTVMPGGVAASDIRRLTCYFRSDAEGRLVMGGRGGFRAGANQALFADLRRTAERLFPQVRGHAVWRHAWGGRVAMTLDGLPRLVSPRPGVFAGYGYNGRGVALSVLMGRELAARALGRKDADCAFPLTGIRQVPFHRLRNAGVALTVRAYRAMDRMGI